MHAKVTQVSLLNKINCCPGLRLPNQQRWPAKMEAQLEYVHVTYMFLHV